MAVPKRKVSKARRDKRRSNVWKLRLPGMVECPQCHEMKLAHRVCKNCGYYNGKEVISGANPVVNAKPAKKEKAVEAAVQPEEKITAPVEPVAEEKKAPAKKETAAKATAEKKPAAKKPAAKKPAAAKADAEKKPAAKKPAASKTTAAKKPAATKTAAAKKPAAKKPAEKAE